MTLKLLFEILLFFLFPCLINYPYFGNTLHAFRLFIFLPKFPPMRESFDSNYHFLYWSFSHSYYDLFSFCTVNISTEGEYSDSQLYPQRPYSLPSRTFSDPRCTNFIYKWQQLRAWSQRLVNKNEQLCIQTHRLAIYSI